MSGPRFSRAEVEQRRETVSRLYLEGKTLVQIAAEVGVSFVQVHHDIRRIRETWRSNTLRNFEECRNRELAVVDQVEVEAWKGWARTIGKVITERHEVSAGETKLVKTTTPQAGDPRFLGIVNECVGQRCKILGLNSPIEARVTGKLSIEDLRAIMEAGGEEPEEEPETVQ